MGVLHLRKPGILASSLVLVVFDKEDLRSSSPTNAAAILPECSLAAGLRTTSKTRHAMQTSVCNKRLRKLATSRRISLSMNASEACKHIHNTKIDLFHYVCCMLYTKIKTLLKATVLREKASQLKRALTKLIKFAHSSFARVTISVNKMRA